MRARTRWRLEAALAVGLGLGTGGGVAGCAGEYRPLSVVTAGGTLRLSLPPGWAAETPLDPGGAQVLYLRPAASPGASGAGAARLPGAYLVLAEATPRRATRAPPTLAALAALERQGACAGALVLACAERPVAGPRVAGRPTLWFERRTRGYLTARVTLAAFAQPRSGGPAWIFLATAAPADAARVQADARRLLGGATWTPAPAG